MICEAHILTWQEELMLPYTLRHYRTFCQRIVVHDSFSTDHTREIAKEAGAEVWDLDTGNQFNDEIHLRRKNTCWVGTSADWVVVGDCDELLYFPSGAELTLAAYEMQELAVIKPHGFEMTSEVFPTTTGQIYDEVKFGARDDKWYAKPIMFSARRVAESGFGVGGHDSHPVLKNGLRLHILSGDIPTFPPCYLLHFHQLGPVERIAKLYDERRQRLAEINVRHGWGNFEPGLKHAQDKRNFIKAGLMQVIP